MEAKGRNAIGSKGKDKAVNVSMLIGSNGKDKAVNVSMLCINDYVYPILIYL